MEETLFARDMSGKPGVTKAAGELMERLYNIIDGIDAYHEYIEQHEKEAKELEKYYGSSIYLSKFQNEIKNELSFVTKNCTADRAHILVSSNSGHYFAVWAAAKTCYNVIGLKWGLREIDGVIIQSRQKNRIIHKKNKKESPGGVIDIVAQGGLEWVKVNYISEKRMLTELCELGLGDPDDFEDELPIADHDDPDGFIKVIQRLIKAVKQERIRYQNPQLRVVLPRISRGSQEVIDIVLAKFTAQGVVFQTSDEIPPEPHITEVLEFMLPKKPRISNIINFDLNVLYSMVSDISHLEIQPRDEYCHQVQSYLKEEQKKPFMPGYIWSVCDDRELVCTSETMNKTIDLVRTIGTVEEQTRTCLLFESTAPGMSQEARVAEFQKLSRWPVPKNWCLPIKVAYIDLEKPKNDPNPIIRDFCKELPEPRHLSVLLYGWFYECTTFTCHAMLANKIKRFFEEQWDRTRLDVLGPDIWVIDTCRGLFGRSESKRLRKSLRVEEEIPKPSEILRYRELLECAAKESTANKTDPDTEIAEGYLDARV